MATFDLTPGEIIAGKYEVLYLLGAGWEGEVYKIRERGTRIERAAKLFFPKRNPNRRAANWHARKLHKLRACEILIHYHTTETIDRNGQSVSVSISEYVEGELLSTYLRGWRGGRLPLFQGIHLLHALAVGVESIHHWGEYHGDLHLDNVIVERLGLGFDLKLIDLHSWGRASRENRQHDLCCMIQVFHEAIGGRKQYAKHPQWVRSICCGLKRTLILKKFRNVSELRIYLESEDWTEWRTLRK